MGNQARVQDRRGVRGRRAEEVLACGDGHRRSAELPSAAVVCRRVAAISV